MPFPRSIVAIGLAVLSANSEGLTIARLLAASAVAKGGQAKAQGIVPGRDDADRAQRLHDHPDRARKKVRRAGAPEWPADRRRRVSHRHPSCFPRGGAPPMTA